jgi:hypothetical protein
LRRNRDGQRQEQLMTAPQRSLYRFLRQKVQRPQIPVTEDFPMPAPLPDPAGVSQTSLITLS